MPVGFSTGIFIIDPKAEARQARQAQKAKAKKPVKSGGLWGWVKAHVRRKDGKIENVKAHRRTR
jgi:hypothetical protein